MDEELIILTQHDFCPLCGSKIEKESDSLHVWENIYECGCKIWGSNEDPSIGKIEIRCR